MEDSYALTMWTFFHVMQMQHLDALEREAERHDLAGLVAYAYHKPDELRTSHARFQARVRDESPLVEARGAQDGARSRALAHVAAHQRIGATPPNPE